MPRTSDTRPDGVGKVAPREGGVPAEADAAGEPGPARAVPPTSVLFSRRVLLPEGVRPAALVVEDGTIAEIRDAPPGSSRDLGDLLLAPGLVDLHGDAFERQIMPRPGVMLDVAIGLEETERQLAANGVTTAFHGLTWSWEPGLRGRETGRRVLATLARLRPRLVLDHRVHLRFETHNLDELEEAAALVEARRVDLLAFNDHTPAIVARASTRAGTLGHALRAGLDVESFDALARAALARGDEVPGAIDRLAAAARVAGVPMLSHDDPSPERRRAFHRLGCRICEFPTNLETAAEAVALGDWVVMGCPNIVRGRSHIGWVPARDLVERDLCSILASDYYYPAILHAVFRLVREGVRDLPRAWALVARHPATAAGLGDRGELRVGARADLVAIDDGDPTLPRVAMTMAAGRLAYRSALV